MMKLSILHFPFLILAAAAIADDPSHASPMARIQRRDSAEAATVANAVGELTYSLDEPGAAALRVGTSDSGTVVVSDPYAIRVAPRRRLAPGEYGVTLSPGAYVREDGAYVLAEDVTRDTGAVTNTLAVRPVRADVKLAEVRYRADAISGQLWRDLTEERCILTGVTKSGYTGGIGSPGRLIVTNLTVWAWAGDVRDTLLDCEATPVPFRDQIGDTSLWALRRWVCDRYDGRTAEEWSRFPAVESVRLNGRSLLYTPGGTLRSEASGGELAWYSGGIAVMRIVGGSTTNSAELNVIALDVDAENQTATLDVTATLGVPVRIETCADIKLGEWHVALGQTSSYPSTVSVGGVDAYRVTVPLDPGADAAFYRAAATIDGDGPGRSLHLGGADTAVHVLDRRTEWTPWYLTLTNGVVLTNWVLTGEAP